MSIRRDFLPQAAFAELLRQVKTYRGKLREIAEGDTIMRKIALDPRTLAALPALAGVLRSPEWRGLIRYIGSRDAEPVVWIQSLSRHACDGPPDPQTLLHADTFHPTVKAWLFLTDVAADAGPFTYVPGSHRLTPQRLAWERRMSLAAPALDEPRDPAGSFRIDPDELREMGLPEPRVFAVPANTLVVADTFGFHARGPSAGRSLRVEIWAYGRRSPFVPWAGFDPWTTAALARRSLIGWQLGDLLERAGVKPHRWRLRTRRCRRSTRLEPSSETRCHGLGPRPIPQIRRAAAAPGARSAAADRCRGARTSSTISAPGPAMSRG